MTLRPCLDCGEPAEDSRCPDHQLPADNHRPNKPPAAERGYDHAWSKLSKRARRTQPWCSDCGATADLQADHSEQAWERKAQGLPIRILDLDVVCGPCNRARGQARTRGITPGQRHRTPGPQARSPLHTGGYLA